MAEYGQKASEYSVNFHYFHSKSEKCGISHGFSVEKSEILHSFSVEKFPIAISELSL